MEILLVPHPVLRQKANKLKIISKEDIKAMIPVVEQELKDAETQKETDASNGKQKLKDLGLTDAEIKALIG